MPKKPAPSSKKTAPQDALIKGLVTAVANAKILSLKSKAYHWNVLGPHFVALHAHFDQLVTLLDTQTDELAERLRALGAFSPGSATTLLAATSLTDDKAVISQSQTILKTLLADLQKTVQHLKNTADIVDDIDDDRTEDMLIQQQTALEKEIWMISSQLA